MNSMGNHKRLNNLRALPLHRAFLISSATLIGRTGTTKILFSSKLFFGELHQDLKHKHIFLYQDRVDFYTELVDTYIQASKQLITVLDLGLKAR